MQPRHIPSPGLLLCGIGLTIATGCDGPSQSIGPNGSESALATPSAPAFAKKGTEKVLASPARIARGEGQTAYVTDPLLGQVVTLDLSGAQPRVTNTLNLKKNVLGVAYGNGRLYIGNVTDGRVDIYDTTRKKPRLVGSLAEPMTYPTDIAIDAAQDLIFVLDGHERVIKVFSLSTGAPLYHVSGPGPGEFHLQNAMGITLDPSTSEIFVSDYGDPADPTYSPGREPRIKIFTFAGAAVVSYTGKLGMLGQRFSRPRGLALNDSGHILVVDALAGEILVLDRASGATLATLGSRGTLPGELALPLDMIVDDAATAYVTNNRSGRIEVFDLGGLP
jgi:DNA-binding beta-propeller fold protein YncE